MHVFCEENSHIHEKLNMYQIKEISQKYSSLKILQATTCDHNLLLVINQIN